MFLDDETFSRLIKAGDKLQEIATEIEEDLFYDREIGIDPIQELGLAIERWLDVREEIGDPE